jgi:hypothetical protein
MRRSLKAGERWMASEESPVYQPSPDELGINKQETS